MTEELLPSEVREKVLQEHAALREQIAAVRAAIDEGGDALLEAARALFDGLLRHLDSEDRILIPTLETIDAWGPQRAQRLRDEHAGQRRWVARTRERLTSDPAALSAQLDRLTTFLERLEKDMEEEESDELNADLLREYPFPVDMGGG
jgi:iron-sulfur cluster repair protein YtfE (RIC family)